MAKRSGTLSELETIYVRGTLAQMLYGFVQGVKSVDPSISVYLACKNFADRFHPDADIDNLILIHQRFVTLMTKTKIETDV